MFLIFPRKKKSTPTPAPKPDPDFVPGEKDAKFVLARKMFLNQYGNGYNVVVVSEHDFRTTALLAAQDYVRENRQDVSVFKLVGRMTVGAPAFTGV